MDDANFGEIRKVRVQGGYHPAVVLARVEKAESLAKLHSRRSVAPSSGGEKMLQCTVMSAIVSKAKYCSHTCKLIGIPFSANSANFLTSSWAHSTALGSIAIRLVIEYKEATFRRVAACTSGSSSVKRSDTLFLGLFEAMYHLPWPAVNSSPLQHPAARTCTPTLTKCVPWP